jgi:hypothetical protein
MPARPPPRAEWNRWSTSLIRYGMIMCSAGLLGAVVSESFALVSITVGILAIGSGGLLHWLIGRHDDS